MYARVSTRYIPFYRNILYISFSFIKRKVSEEMPFSSEVSEFIAITSERIRITSEEIAITSEVILINGEGILPEKWSKSAVFEE